MDSDFSPSSECEPTVSGPVLDQGAGSLELGGGRARGSVPYR